MKKKKESGYILFTKWRKYETIFWTVIILIVVLLKFIGKILQDKVLYTARLTQYQFDTLQIIYINNKI